MRLVEAAERIRTGELSALELLETTLSRIARLNPEVRAFATQTPELARREAARVDERIASGERALPLAGVPVAVKDLLATRDAPTHAGTVVRKNWNPGVDATVVTRLREAGAVLVGKLTTTEGASGVHHPSVTPPINPWNADYWTGASSSGSGAATAAGLCFAALGSDTGGSIRFPSACCGLVGLKPTWGRVSRFGVFPLAESLDHVGPMARGVADAAAIFEAISGHDPRDPTTLHGAPARLEADTSGVRGLRVGYDEAYCRDGIAPLVADAISKSVDVLREAGAEICRLRVPERPEMISGWLVLCAMEAVAANDGFYPERGEDYGPALAAARAMIDRIAVQRDWEAFFADVDLVIAPSTAGTTPTLEEGRTQMRGDGMRRLIRYTVPANLAGLPTLSLPAGLDPAGVPYGFQLVGNLCAEAVLLRAGQAVEEALGFPDLWDRDASWD
jgi:amidase